MSARIAGMVLGKIAFMVALIAGGIFVGRKIGRRRGKSMVWWPVIVSVLLVLAAAVARTGRAHG